MTAEENKTTEEEVKMEDNSKNKAAEAEATPGDDNSGSSDKPEENAEELSEEDRELSLRAERKKTALEVLHQAEQTWGFRIWKWRYDKKRGFFLKMQDLIERINRGGNVMEVVKHCAFGIPPIILGHHLDDDGRDLLTQNMGKVYDPDLVKKGENLTLEDVVIWAIDYVPGQSAAPQKREVTPEEPVVVVKVDLGNSRLNGLADLIPFMHPKNKPCTWRQWVDKVHEVLDGEGLTEQEYLDIMQQRMGGGFLTHNEEGHEGMTSMRFEGKDRSYIEEYFLSLDYTPPPEMDGIDMALLASLIPFMQPKNKPMPFRQWFALIRTVLAEHAPNLDEEETLDIIEWRMGGGYLIHNEDGHESMQSMRKEKRHGKDRAYIEKYFIYLDLGDAIPFMEPKTKPMTWRAWLKIVHDVLDDVEPPIEPLTDKQYLNIMQKRMGGGFLLHNEETHESMKSMRSEGKDQKYIEEYFLRLDLLDKIPFRHPKDQDMCSWRAWMDIVHKVLDCVGLTEEQYLNIMQARMGGGFLLHNEEGHESMKSMRAEGQERDYIEQYFLSLDPWVPEYQSVRMMRPSLKENWGIKMGYLVSSPHVGLQLVIGEIQDFSPAWKSGLRVGDGLTVINDWSLTTLSKPEVACMLFSACAHQCECTVLRPFDGSLQDCRAFQIV